MNYTGRPLQEPKRYGLLAIGKDRTREQMGGGGKGKRLPPTSPYPFEREALGTKLQIFHDSIVSQFPN